jgi:hypothetical protein
MEEELKHLREEHAQSSTSEPPSSWYLGVVRTLWAGRRPLSIVESTSRHTAHNHSSQNEHTTQDLERIESLP